ncbi:hypothetical protein PG988_003470 [Apiospora saccharicola]
MGKPKNRASKAQREEELRNQKSRQSKAAPPCAARDFVFATPELLEIIFSFTTMRDLLTSGQRVCRLWKGVIDQSPRLQKHLFFQPEDEKKEDLDGTRMHRANSPASSENPLLRRAFREFFFPGHQQRSVRFQLPHLRELPIADMKNGRQRHGAFVRAGASWRSMLVSQPPPGELVLDASGHAPDGPGQAVIRLRGPVRMGLLYDLACHGAIYDHAGVEVAWTPDPHTLVEPTRSTMPGWIPDNQRWWFERTRADRGLQSSIALKWSAADGGNNNNSVVVVGTFPRILKRKARHPSRMDRYWRKEVVMKRIRDDGTRWMFLCEEYDAEEIERRIEEAEDEA